MKKFHYIVFGCVVTSLCLSNGCSNPQKETGTGEATKRCQVHKTDLKTINGFTFGGDVLADPSWDYVRFMDETRFPNTIPWEFSEKHTDTCTQPLSIDYCQTCEAEFQQGFADFQRMTEAEKEVLFMESLRREVENKKQNKILR